MALSALGAFVILGLLLCLVYYFAWEITRPLRRSRYDLLVRASMPPDIRHAPLAWSEQTFKTGPGDLPIAAKVDQVYGRPGRDALVCVETKTRRRGRVTEADRIQLSAQAYALRAQGYRTTRHGYVRLVREHEERYYRVPLLGDEELRELVDRYWDLVSGREPPRPTAKSARCRGCGHRAYCPHRPK